MQSSKQPSLEITTSRQFTSWLHEQKISLAFSTYQAGKLFFIGLQSNGKLSVFERTFERCMGLCVYENSFYMSSLYQLWRFENALQPKQVHNDYDCLYVPQVGYITGDLDIHDLVMGKLPTKTDPQESIFEQPKPLSPIFINTLFSCIATISETHSFIPLWKPPFISRLAAEDRCHLNGLALVENQARYVTAVSQSDVGEGWRDMRHDGGCVIDVANDEVITTGLSMPHSPRWYRGKLWLLNSGTGEFGYVNLNDGSFEGIAFCPGYLRGFALSGNFAIVGVSKPRNNKTFSGLKLDENLMAKNASARCGLLVIDLRSGDIVHSLRIEGVIEELYDVVVIPKIRRPMAIGFKTDEIRRVITIGE